MKQLQTVDARFRREGGISVRHNIVMQRVTPNSCTKLIRPACLKPALQCGCTQSLDCCSAKTNHRLKEKLTDSLIAMKGLVVALLPAVALGQLLAGGIVDTTVGPKYEPVVFAVSKINEQLAATNAGQTPVDLLEVVKARTQVIKLMYVSISFFLPSFLLLLLFVERAFLSLFARNRTRQTNTGFF